MERKVDVMAMPLVRQAVADVEATLGDTGRVLLRPSGTEPVIRVMVEGQDDATVARHADALAGVVENAARDAADCAA